MKAGKRVVPRHHKAWDWGARRRTSAQANKERAQRLPTERAPGVTPFWRRPEADPTVTGWWDAEPEYVLHVTPEGWAYFQPADDAPGLSHPWGGLSRIIGGRR